MSNWNANRSYDLTDEKETQEYLRDVETEYSFGCYDQKEPDACHRLAEFYESVRKNFLKAGPIYQENCDNTKYPRSCHKFAQWLLSAEKGNPSSKEDRDKALHYYERSCELGMSKGCFNAAVVRLQSGGAEQENEDKAFSLFDKACSMGMGEACFDAHTAHLLGQRRVKDLPKAFAYARAGCLLDHIGCCSNLSLMFRHGHGVEKNDLQAQESRAKAIRLHNQYKNPGPSVKVNQ